MNEPQRASGPGMNEPRRTAIHRSINRPHLLLGAERGLVLMAGVVTALLVFSGSISPTSILVAVTFWTCTFWGLVRMGKADPQMSRVYQRHIHHRAYYSARSCVEATLPGGGSPKA
jgi:type IV secretory pathway TrbD component